MLFTRSALSYRPSVLSASPLCCYSAAQEVYQQNTRSYLLDVQVQSPHHRVFGLLRITEVNALEGDVADHLLEEISDILQFLMLNSSILVKKNDFRNKR